eukprot:gene9610-7523_t
MQQVVSVSLEKVPTPAKRGSSEFREITSFRGASRRAAACMTTRMIPSSTMLLAVLLVVGLVSKPIQCLDVPGAISAGEYRTCVLFTNGRVKCWGESYGYSSRGIAREILPHTLDYVDMGIARTATTIATSGYRTCASLENADFACASDSCKDYTTINMGTGRTATAVAIGLAHFCVILDNGDLKCWGSNSNGQLGFKSDATPSSYFGITSVVISDDLGTGRTATAIAAGGYHTCAILDNGELVCWGSNDDGQTGGTVSLASSPVNLGTGRTATARIGMANWG